MPWLCGPLTMLWKYPTPAVFTPESTSRWPEGGKQNAGSVSALTILGSRVFTLTVPGSPPAAPTLHLYSPQRTTMHNWLQVSRKAATDYCTTAWIPAADETQQPGRPTCLRTARECCVPDFIECYAAKVYMLQQISPTTVYLLQRRMTTCCFLTFSQQRLSVP